MKDQFHSSEILKQVGDPILSTAHTRAQSIRLPLARPDSVQSETPSPLASRKASPRQTWTRGTEGAKEIEEAYDALHRVLALLAYLKFMNKSDSGFGPILDEAMHTYGQAFSLYEAHDFEGSSEFALASKDLSRAVEIIISRTVRSDALYPTLVLLPPEYQTALDDSTQMRRELSRVESLLSLIRRVAKSGTCLSRDQEQTLFLVSCSEHLLKKARLRLGLAAIPEAIDLVRAAAAAARAAKRVCWRWYATQGIDPYVPPQLQRRYPKCDLSPGLDAELD